MSDTAALYDAHRDLLWGLCYRMTGSAADADDLVQDAFVRAMERPPKDLQRSLRPWLVRVATNLGRDLLRRRQRRSYPGPWLPAPVDTAQLEIADYTPGPDVRYGLLESATFAFLLAVEALTPKQRAVLILRDVLDFDGAETAAALEISVADVRTTLFRARSRMAAYDEARCIPDTACVERHSQALQDFVGGLMSGDVQTLAGLLHDDVVACSDAGGEYHAATRYVHGALRVAKLYVGLGNKNEMPQIELRSLNGLPALVLRFDEKLGRRAPLSTLSVTADGAGRIVGVEQVMASRKLSAIRSQA